MVKSSNLGFPRMGPQRELKKIVEGFWSGKVSQESLLSQSKSLREQYQNIQKSLDFVPSNDFSLYDHVLDHSVLFDVIPSRYRNLAPGLETYFAMARGLQRESIDVPACEMKKWFDTNYHYIVPEFQTNQEFKLIGTKPIEEFLEAKEKGITTRPVLLGPITYLLLGKPDKNSTGFQTIDLLEKLLPVYEELLKKLADNGAEWIQLDEPFLVFDLDESFKNKFKLAYERLSKVNPSIKLLIATYFGAIGSNITFVQDLPIQGLHIDLARAPDQLEPVLEALKSKTSISLSLGIVNGRNIWKTDLSKAISTVKKVVDVVGTERVIVGPSSSMLHSPHSLEHEVTLRKHHPELLDWLAFAVEKVNEISLIVKASNEGDNIDSSIKEQLTANTKSIQSRLSSPHTTNPSVRQRIEKVTEDMIRRKSAFIDRQVIQRQKLGLPMFATTTIGSFPQTKEIRLARSKFNKNTITREEYEDFIKKEIAHCIQVQENLGLDVLVHGEAERDDMVAYFGKLLGGFLFTDNGWVQSYGSRCVKPPVIYGDVERPVAMTIKETIYAQSLTSKPVKGMLTGPVTLLQWSFVRDDIPRSEVCKQLALAVRDEVSDLEKAGIKCIQVDEPAIREGLPLRRSEWNSYLKWSVDAFLLGTAVVRDETQIHTHMCYSDFGDIFEAIQKMDADVISIENSRSDMKLLSVFESKGYTNEIGPGVYDIHSPRVPAFDEIKDRTQALLKNIPSKNLWINPDCGLKTRGWSETEASLKNLVGVAKSLRQEHQGR